MLAYKLWILSHTDRRVQHSNASCTLRRWILQLLQGERRLTARWAHSNRAQWANDWMQNRLSCAAVQYETSNRTDSIRTIRPFVRNRFVRFGESYVASRDDSQQKARIPTTKPALGISLCAPYAPHQPARRAKPLGASEPRRRPTAAPAAAPTAAPTTAPTDALPPSGPRARTRGHRPAAARPRGTARARWHGYAPRASRRPSPLQPQARVGR